MAILVCKKSFSSLQPIFYDCWQFNYPAFYCRNRVLSFGRFTQGVVVSAGSMLMQR